MRYSLANGQARRGKKERTSKRKGGENVAEVRRGTAEEPMDGRERCAGLLSLSEDNGNK